MKAHQDDDTPYAQLPMYAQLNVDADTLASEFHDAHGSVRPILLMTPSIRVLPHLPRGSITGKFASTLRTAYSGPPLLQAVQSKNSWSDSTAESVHWEAHRLSLGKNINRSTHYTNWHTISFPLIHGSTSSIKASAHARVVRSREKTKIIY